MVHVNNKDDVLDEDTICGFGCFRPKWIQKYATARSYLISYSVIGIVQSAYYNYFIAAMSTLEKRFAFDTKVSGSLLLAEELTPLLFGIPVGYIGGKTHRPRLVAIGTFLSAICCFMSAIPYFIYGSSKHLSIQSGVNETNVDFCASEWNHASCDGEDRPPTKTVVGIFLLGSLFKGFSTISNQVVGLSYLDDAAKKKNSPLYLAITMALRLVGPLFGFLMSSAFLKYYENPLEDPGYGPEDPRWIGAWWLGFLIQGFLLVIVSIPLVFFPRRLPGHRKPESNNQLENKETIKDIFKGLFPAIKRLAKNPVFVIVLVNTLMIIYGHFGHGIMVPKYMENQFRLTASDASLYSGATEVVCIIVATLLGGFLIWKYTPSAKRLLAILIVSETIFALGYLVMMIPRCEKHEMLNFGTKDGELILDGICNLNCNCTTTSYTPFCGPDGKTLYFSPCYAGCTQQLPSVMSDKEHMVFGNCSCVADEFKDIDRKITKGYCFDENCWFQAKIYIALLLILEFISSVLNVAHTMIFLRCVHPDDKSVALGTFETLLCLFGFIPFPVVFGALVDSACIVWERSCNKTGNCWFYDMDTYNYTVHGFSAVFCGGSVLCVISLYYLSARIRSLYKEEDEENENHAEIKLGNVSGPATKL